MFILLRPKYRKVWVEVKALMVNFPFFSILLTNVLLQFANVQNNGVFLLDFMNLEIPEPVS